MLHLYNANWPPLKDKHMEFYRCWQNSAIIINLWDIDYNGVQAKVCVCSRAKVSLQKAMPVPQEINKNEFKGTLWVLIYIQ